MLQFTGFTDFQQRIDIKHITDDGGALIQSPTPIQILQIGHGKNMLDMINVVIDPFMGSGSTCVSAALNNRRYIGIELDQTYYQIANDRIINLNELTK